MSAREMEIYSMPIEIFNYYLKGISNDEVKLYEDTKLSCGLKGHVSERVLKDNLIKNKINTFLNRYSNFELKLIELACLFPNDKQWNSFSKGNPNRNESPLSEDELAHFYGTTQENVRMKKSLDDALNNFKEYNSKNLVK